MEFGLIACGVPFLVGAICVSNGSLIFEAGVHDVVVQYLPQRVGDRGPSKSPGSLAINSPYNMVVDHCSVTCTATTATLTCPLSADSRITSRFRRAESVVPVGQDVVSLQWQRAHLLVRYPFALLIRFGD